MVGVGGSSPPSPTKFVQQKQRVNESSSLFLFVGFQKVSNQFPLLSIWCRFFGGCKQFQLTEAFIIGSHLRHAVPVFIDPQPALHAIKFAIQVAQIEQTHLCIGEMAQHVRSYRAAHTT